MTERRRPIHLAVMIGAATTAYAVSLAGVTALQSEADQALIARRSPSEEAAARLGDGHDRLETDVERAARAYAASAARYDELTATLESLEASLERYAGRVEAVTGAAQALPGRVRLPTVTRTITRTSSKPGVTASTGASGG
jgi:hypothetical protein